MRLIDADELKEEMLEESDWWENADVWVAHNVIDKAPTVVPAKRGEWLESECFDYCFWVCSNCRFPSEALAAPRLYKYCPQCGAKMESDDK